MKLGSETIVYDLIDGILIRFYGRYKLSRLQLEHRWSRQNLPIEEQCLHQDLSVYRIGQPSRIDGWGLEWVS